MFEKYRIILLRKINSVYYTEKVFNLKELPKTLRFKGKEFKIPSNYPMYIGKGFFNDIRVYFLDFDTMSEISTSETKSLITPEELDLFLGQNIIKQIASGVLQNMKEKIMFMVIGGLIGLLIGGMIAMYYYTGQIQELLLQQQASEPEIIIQSLRGI